MDDALRLPLTVSAGVAMRVDVVGDVVGGGAICDGVDGTVAHEIEIMGLLFFEVLIVLVRIEVAEVVAEEEGVSLGEVLHDAEGSEVTVAVRDATRDAGALGVEDGHLLVGDGVDEVEVLELLDRFDSVARKGARSGIDDVVLGDNVRGGGGGPIFGETAAGDLSE